MASETSRLRIKKVGDVSQIEFIDRNILDEANIQHIGEEIASIIEASPKPKLLISFANVDHLSSAALGTLITINNKVRSAGGQLRLADIDQTSALVNSASVAPIVTEMRTAVRIVKQAAKASMPSASRKRA